MRKSLFISSYPLPWAAVSLGRLVSFIKHPGQDSFDPAIELPHKPQVHFSTSEINHISKILEASDGAGLELVLTAFAKVFLRGEIKDARQLVAKQGTEYLLLNADTWFEQVCKFDLTRTWLERASMRGRHTYLVTGIQTLRDVDITIDKSKKLGTGVGVDVPLAAATGVPLPTPLDPAANADYSIERVSKTFGTVPEEKIYGIQYREVKLKKETATNPLAARLTSKIWWEQIYSDRGPNDGDMDADETDIIEAQLQDDFTDTAEYTSVVSASGDEIYIYA